MASNLASRSAVGMVGTAGVDRPALAAASVAAPALRILAISSNLRQASTRLRISALLRPLRARGIEMDLVELPKGWFGRRELLRSCKRYHAVILQRKLLDPWNLQLLRRHARRLLFDVDDAVMYHPNAVGPLSRIRTSVRFAWTSRAIDHVVAGNEYLAARFRARGCAASIVPTVIEVGRYQVKRHEATVHPRLVWIGSQSTLPYLRELLPVIRSAKALCPGLRLLTIGDEALHDAELPVEHIPWSVATESQSLNRGDIGIAPTPCDRWTLGKCGFKILQYMAAGLPVIASPVGANASLVQHSVTGLLAARPQDWPGAIAALAGDVSLRAAMGAAGRRAVEQRHSIEQAADAWAELLEK